MPLGYPNPSPLTNATECALRSQSRRVMAGHGRGIVGHERVRTRTSEHTRWKFLLDIFFFEIAFRINFRAKFSSNILGGCPWGTRTLPHLRTPRHGPCEVRVVVESPARPRYCRARTSEQRRGI